MQIISGKFRGKKLEWVLAGSTRPTASRVKESIFNVLASTGVNFGVVLDLFGGSGQMGIECVSRGANKVIFNDINPQAVAVIKKNCTSINALSHTEISNLDYMECLQKYRSQKFDIVFLDPPYEENTFALQAIEFIAAHKMLVPGGVIVVESEKDGIEFGGFAVRTKKYGRARIYFLSHYKQ